MPEALSRLGYGPAERVALVTFDSTSERVPGGGARHLGRGGRGAQGQDPSVSQLRSLDVDSRGSTTLLAPAVNGLWNVLEEARVRLLSMPLSGAAGWCC